MTAATKSELDRMQMTLKREIDETRELVKKLAQRLEILETQVRSLPRR